MSTTTDVQYMKSFIIPLHVNTTDAWLQTIKDYNNTKWKPYGGAQNRKSKTELPKLNLPNRTSQAKPNQTSQTKPPTYI